MADAEVVRCNACGGIYAPVQQDGSQYFHACPDRKVVGSTPAPTKDDPDATAPVFAPIADRRDENIIVDKDGRATPKRETVGITPVTDPDVLAALTGGK